MSRVVVKRKKKKKEKPDRGRNEGKSEVYGISASRKFWDKVTEMMAKNGTNRSETIVQAVSSAWGDESILSNPVGRPKDEE